MAAILKRSHVGVLARAFGKNERLAIRSHGSARNFRKKLEKGTRTLAVSLGVLAGVATLRYAIRSIDSTVKPTSVPPAAPPRYPWQFDGVFASLDHAAIRRGWQIYRTVCSTCHSLRYVCFRDLVDVSHTREEMTAIAAEYEVDDGPDDQGNYYKRPGKLSDSVPSPFPNEEAARAANSGAYPPDLTHIVLARRNGQNYVFSLLTGYMNAPAGVTLTDTQHFNPYFPGAGITMLEMLQDGVVDYDDGTPATKSQMSKDIIEFLVWTSSPDHDHRKLLTLKVLGISVFVLISIIYIKRRAWTTVMSQQIYYIPRDKCK